MGGLDVKGDLIELVDKGAGLEDAVLRKTRAGGNWLTGGIVMSLLLRFGDGSIVWTSRCRNESTDCD